MLYIGGRYIDQRQSGRERRVKSRAETPRSSDRKHSIEWRRDGQADLKASGQTLTYLDTNIAETVMWQTVRDYIGATEEPKWRVDLTNRANTAVLARIEYRKDELLTGTRVRVQREGLIYENGFEGSFGTMGGGASTDQNVTYGTAWPTSLPIPNVLVSGQDGGTAAMVLRGHSRSRTGCLISAWNADGTASVAYAAVPIVT